MASYRTMLYIPLAADVPGVGMVEATSGEMHEAIGFGQHFDADVQRYSASMGACPLTMRVLDVTLPATVYDTYAGGHFIHPVLLAEHLGDLGSYDVFAMLCPQGLMVRTTWRGLGGTRSGAMFAYMVMDGDERDGLVHEFGHAMTSYLTTVTGEYTNFPTCGGDPAIHCAAEYGFVDDLDPLWLEAFFQGTVGEGSGLTATAWSLQTPTDRGDVSLPQHREHPTPWGLLGGVTLS